MFDVLTDKTTLVLWLLCVYHMCVHVLDTDRGKAKEKVGCSKAAYRLSISESMEVHPLA